MTGSRRQLGSYLVRNGVVRLSSWRLCNDFRWRSSPGTLIIARAIVRMDRIRCKDSMMAPTASRSRGVMNRVMSMVIMVMITIVWALIAVSIPNPGPPRRLYFEVQGHL